MKIYDYIAAFLLGLLWSSSAQSLTIVIDFNSPNQPTTRSIGGNVVDTFDVVAFGFQEQERDFVEERVYRRVVDQYFGIPTQSEDPLSPIPSGRQLDLDIVVGDIGASAPNGDADYFFIQVGSGVSGPHINGRGVAGIGLVRDMDGSPHPSFGLGGVFGAVFTDTVAEISGLVPADALTSGMISFVEFALGDLIAHEIAHGLSLRHLDWLSTDVTLTGATPLMASGTENMPFSEYITDRAWDYASLNQLVGAVGLQPIRPIPEPATWVMVALGLVVLGRASLCRRLRG